MNNKANTLISTVLNSKKVNKYFRKEYFYNENNLSCKQKNNSSTFVLGASHKLN